jgi:hypothetical protein
VKHIPDDDEYLDTIKELKLKLRDDLNEVFLKKYDELPSEIIINEALLALVSISVIFNYDPNVVVNELEKGFKMASLFIKELESVPLTFLSEIAEA